MNAFPLFKKISLKFIFIILSALLSALGTMVYGFRFVEFLNHYNHFLFLFIGGIFAFFSVAANAALGTYSLLNSNTKQTLINPYGLAIGSFFSAIPYGFICYFGYEKYLPFFINVPMSLIVVIVNTGIAYTAIYNFLVDFFKNAKVKASNQLKLVHGLGFIIGFLVSATTYVATVHGMYNLLIQISPNHVSTVFYISCVVGVLSWIPFAALYSNSTKIVFEQLYVFLVKQSKKAASLDKRNLMLLIVALGSGASFSQMAIDFFDPSRDIPVFLKNDIIQFFIYKFIVPAAFFSSAAVNYLALQRLFEKKI